MGSKRILKITLITVWAIGGFLLSVSLSNDTVVVATTYSADDYVGSETCKGCHGDQFAHFSKTIHAKVQEVGEWKGKMQGCESCHGPGKLHVEGGGDKTKIRTFAAETAKQISETCLTCHAGNDGHNNYRRGEHWRNDVGCTDCHSPHTPLAPARRADSLTLIGDASLEKPGTATIKMLRAAEPQLCLKCHNETKSQFTQPFHHKVLEGTIKCSDCHNAHGGFEAKQTRLASGADAVCMKCHTDKQGPFVFEHAPLKTEGCTICHTPHGANSPKLLRRSDVRQLCLECHSNAAEIGAPNTPSFHNQATARFQNCTTCHVKIHGSQTSPVFFR